MHKTRGRPLDNQQRSTFLKLEGITEFDLMSKARRYANTHNLTMTRFVEICIHEFFINNEDNDGK